MNVSVSIGIAEYISGVADHEKITHNADVAMYFAKESGRNNYKYFSEDLKTIHNQKTELENALKEALDNYQISILYQPIVNLRTKHIVKLEVFASWIHPERGKISPEIFIPLAEEMGLIDIIGRNVLRAACEQGARWHHSGYRNFQLSINLSPRQLIQQDLPLLIHDIIRATRIPINLLEFELTETSAIIYSSLSSKILQKIRDMGIGITLDDFGTGYSSLSHLKELPIKAIKIDKEFIHDIHKNKNTEMIVKSIITMGNNLQFEVIAEGIETQNQLDYLVENQCPLGQGYLLYRPMTEDQITQLLNNEKNKQADQVSV